MALGGALSAAAAASVATFVLRGDQDQLILSELVSAHLRSLQADHLTDVLSSDQHTVRPWFNGRLDVSPPVVALTAQGFTLIGGRLDYINARPVAAVVYKRRAHIINVFVLQARAAAPFTWQSQSLRGFNIRRWMAQGLDLMAVSDISAEELQEFVQTFNGQLKVDGT
jgi:anti-sigma factor RsiW